MRKAIALLAAYAVLFAPLVVTAQWQVAGPKYSEIMYVSDSVNYNATDAAAAPSSTNNSAAVILVKYVGPDESGTFDIVANTLRFYDGDLGSEVIPATAAEDVNSANLCGTANGDLDVTDAQCDTPAEVVGVINSSSAGGVNWIAVLLDVPRAETLATITEYEDDPGATQAKLPGGLAIGIDNVAVDSLSLLMVPTVGRAMQSASGKAFVHGTSQSGRDDIEFFLNRPAVAAYPQTYKANPFAGTQAVLTGVSAVLDSTGGWVLQIYAVRYPTASFAGDAAVAPTFGAAATQRLVWQEDGTDVTYINRDFSRAPLVSAPGETFLVVASDDALVTGTVAYYGFFVPSAR